MHQVACRYETRAADDHSTNYLMSTVLIAANTLDAELFSTVLLKGPSVALRTATADADFGMTRCQRLRPNLLIVDPKIDGDIIPRGIELVDRGVVKHLLVLDDRLHEARLASLLALPAVSYLTRNVGLATLQDEIERIARTGERTFDPEIEKSLERVGKVLTLTGSQNPHSVAALTSRELEVMTMLARGFSVRKCAEHLKLAESTVDNHKSRLMKKLDVHKIVELTHVAILEGLIVV